MIRLGSDKNRILLWFKKRNWCKTRDKKGPGANVGNCILACGLQTAPRQYVWSDMTGSPIMHNNSSRLILLLFVLTFHHLWYRQMLLRRQGAFPKRLTQGPTQGPTGSLNLSLVPAGHMPPNCDTPIKTQFSRQRDFLIWNHPTLDWYIQFLVLYLFYLLFRAH